MSECSHNCGTCGENCSSRTQDKKSFLEALAPESSVKKVIGVVSGKGGVGKSLVTSMMAVSMSRKGKHAAILDADITGPSIPMAFGVAHEKAGVSEDGKLMIPARSLEGVDIMSANLLLDHDTDPVIWRGPVIAGAVKQFWTETLWKDVDYMFVDMPPGTGDVPLTVFQSLPVDGIVVVTSPQELVQMIVKKAYGMAKQMNIPVLGIVENYSYVKCPDCGNMIFPKIAPAVIVGVTDGDRILMTKYADREYKKYALIAGFTEIGETAEQTVEREVMEEVGLSVENIRYYKSQPWGYDSNLLLGYFCDLAQKREIHLDETELSLAEWVDYRDIPDDPEGLSLTREMMITFREQKKREHSQRS